MRQRRIIKLQKNKKIKKMSRGETSLECRGMSFNEQLDQGKNPRTVGLIRYLPLCWIEAGEGRRKYRLVKYYNLANHS